jgi:hypothetical protein
MMRPFRNRRVGLDVVSPEGGGMEGTLSTTKHKKHPPKFRPHIYHASQPNTKSHAIYHRSLRFRRSNVDSTMTGAEDKLYVLEYHCLFGNDSGAGSSPTFTRSDRRPYDSVGCAKPRGLGMLQHCDLLL